ncbi:MAG: hypothetical protein ACT4PV_16030 [Planctomycetaceae bacterium]
MRILAILLAAVAAASAAENEAIVAKVRALVSAKKTAEREALLAELKATKDLDWASVRAGLMKGPYYTDPMVTEFGDRHSNRHFGSRFTPEDKRDRAFSMVVPKSYKASEKMPVLLYLHHEASNQNYNDMRGSVALPAFREFCEKQGFLYVAPSANAGVEWWTPEGRAFIRWTLDEVRARYNVDEDRIALMGVLDGASSVYSIAQWMPDTFSCLIALTGNPVEIARDYHPIFLGPLDRTDIFAAITGRNADGVNLFQMLELLKPMFDQGVRLTLRTYPKAATDVRYFDEILPAAVQFAMDRKRKPYADEVDLETDNPSGARSLWLGIEGIDPEGAKPHNFPSTLYPFPEPRNEDPRPKLGLGLGGRGPNALGISINGSEGGAQRSGVLPGDVLLEVDGMPVTRVEDVATQTGKRKENEDVHLLLAREIGEDDLELMRERQKRYLKRRARMLEDEKAGREFLDVDDVLGEDEEGGGEGSGESEIAISGEDDPAKDQEKEKGGGRRGRRVWFLFERWVRLRSPEPPLVRGDFGASWDPEFKQEGVKLARVARHGHAWRSGLRDGDVLYALGGTEVKKVRDVRAFFKEFDFKGFMDFDVKRPATGGSFEERSFRVSWEPRPSARVDVQWDAKERTMNVLARNAKAFTIYYADDVLKPGEPFKLYINGVPFLDLLDPATMPEYEEPLPGDSGGHEKMKQARHLRAAQLGWVPDPIWALEAWLEHRDRSLVFGAKRTIEMGPLKAGFEAAAARERKRQEAAEERLRKAREGYRAEG